MCPARVFSVKGNKLSVERPDQCILCRTCEEITDGAIQVTGDPDRFVFQFETDGSVDALTALAFSLRTLIDKFDDFRESISNL